MKKLMCFSLAILICLTFASTLAFAKKGEVPEAKGKPFEGTEITVIYMSGGYADAARDVAAKFKEMTGASVIVADYPWGGLHEKLFAELIAGTGNFDMVCMAGQWMGEIVPYLEDIGKYIEGPDVISDFQKSSYDVYNFSGVQYGFPYQTDAYSVFYRTDIFEENGIEADPDWTWDDYLKIAKKLTKGGMYGTSLAGVKHQQNVYFINRYWGLGGKTTSPDWKVTMDNPTTIKALKQLKETYKYTSPKAAGGDISEMNNVFLSGNEVAMLEGWPSLIFGLLDNPDASNVIGKWSVLPLPGGGPIYGSLWGIGISKDSKNKEAAYEWIKFYTSKENQLYFWEKYGMIPVRKSIWADPDILKVRPYAANYGLGLGRARPNWRITAANEGWEGILNDEVSKYLIGDQTAEETAENLQREWTELLKRKPASEGYKNTE
jgi:ABC-type glycerol-3-phosphate transport system substrate-binding protein